MVSKNGAERYRLLSKTERRIFDSARQGIPSNRAYETSKPDQSSASAFLEALSMDRIQRLSKNDAAKIYSALAPVLKLYYSQFKTRIEDNPKFDALYRRANMNLPF